MVYHVGDMLLEVMQELFRGKVNDVVVCQDKNAVNKVYYTVLIIKNHDTAKRMVEIYDAAGGQGRQAQSKGFTWKDEYLMVFDYKVERPIDKFFSSVIRTAPECEKLCVNIVTECIASAIPYPVLYQQLAQNQLYIQRDGSVGFGYNLDLAGLSAMKTEKDCASLCAKKLFVLLGYVKTGTTSYRLLEMKNQREGYARFVDLYRDIRAAEIPIEKKRRFEGIRLFFRRNQEWIFRTLLFLCLTAGAIALLMVLSQLIFADIPLFRLFVNTFKQIGTESLLK